ELGRCLARTEPGNTDLLSELLVYGVEVRLQLLKGHLDGDPDPRRAQLLDGALHGLAPLSFRAPRSTGPRWCRMSGQFCAFDAIAAACRRQPEPTGALPLVRCRSG